MYQVGFGDCFLVSVEYDAPLADGRAERHLLIDFGTSHSPREGRARGRMADVAALIEQHTGGELDVLVVYAPAPRPPARASTSPRAAPS